MSGPEVLLAAVCVPVALVRALSRLYVVVGSGRPGRAVLLSFVTVLAPLSVSVPQVRGAAFVRRLRLAAVEVWPSIP